MQTENQMETPETNACYARAGMMVLAQLDELDVTCRRMECELGKAIATIESIAERYIEGCDTYEDWKFMGESARAYLAANVESTRAENKP